MKETPLVSIVCITYNHEKYLRRTLDSFLAQKTTFAYEIVLAEDCSSDSTRQICEEYKKSYPDIINYICSESNVGSKLNECRAMLAARGQYIATCEGDDYWTDPDKLQKQVDFMNIHHNAVACFTLYDSIEEKSGKVKTCEAKDMFEVKGNPPFYEITTMDFATHWYTQYLTMLFRKEALPADTFKAYKFYRDTHQVYHLMQCGAVYVLNFVGGVYNITGDGVYSKKDGFDKALGSYRVCDELRRVNRDKTLNNLCVIMLQEAINAKTKGIRLHKTQLAFCQFMHVPNIKCLIKNIIRIWKINVR